MNEIVTTNTLHQYRSFSTPNQSSNQMMIEPTNIFDKWMENIN
jgi:hypothetical protein